MFPMKIFKQVLLVMLLSGLALPALGQGTSKVGTSAAQFLRLPVGARSAAMGGAVTGDIADASSMFWNPAGLADINDYTVMVEYADWFVDVNHNYLGVVLPSKHGNFGLNVVALNMGEMEETTYDFPEGTGRTFSAYSVAIGASYAHYLMKDFRMGVNLKFVNETIMNSSAQTFAFDIGTLYKLPFLGLRFGVSVTNVGGKMQMDGDDLIIPVDLDEEGRGNYEPDAKLATRAYPLPLRLKVGFAWDAVKNENTRVTLTLDGNSPSDNTQSVSVGTEIGLLDDLVMLRGGLPNLGQEDRTDEFTTGIGIKYPINENLKVNVGYAFQKFKYLDYVNRMTLSVQF